MNATTEAGRAEGTTGWEGSTQDRLYEAGEQAKNKASHLAEVARDGLRSKVNEGKERAVTELDHLAQALRETGEHLENHFQAPTGRLTHAAADRVDDLSQFLRDQDFDRMVSRATSFAREQPVMFLGSAFVLGFLASRFFRSSADGAPETNRRLPETFTPSLNASPSGRGWSSSTTLDPGY